MMRTAFLHGYGLALILLVLSIILSKALTIISKTVKRLYERKNRLRI